VLFIAADPTGLVLATIEHVPVLPDALRRYNLIAGLPLAAALLASSGIDDMLVRNASRTVPTLLRWLWAGAAAVWAAYLLSVWPPGGPEFVKGFSSAIYPAVLLPIFAAGLLIVRATKSTAVAAIIVCLVLVDYKAFGTNRRFNAAVDNVDSYWRGDARVGGPSLNGLDTTVYHEMLRHPGYRLAIHEGPHSTDMRHYRIATLQGFDPFLPDQYKAAVEQFVPFKTNRLFEINPLDEKMLRHFGVRWIILRHESETETRLLKHPSFRRIPPGTSYYVVFEYLHAEPAWKFDGDVTMTGWTPEVRSFRVRSRESGRFVLKEQFFPGWKATVDGMESSVERSHGIFQSIHVPAGEHIVEFRYAPRSLLVGAPISGLGILLAGWAAWPRRRPKR
jgi:hypothetical protein